LALGFLTRSDDGLREHPRDGSLPRPRQPVVCGPESSRWPTIAFIRPGGHLTEALRTGLPQNELKGGGEGLFETIYADPARLQEFLASMTGISHAANQAIAQSLPVDGLLHLC